MSTRVNRVNRALLALIGLLLLAAGVVGLVLSLGGFGADQAGAALLPDQVRDVADRTPWFWWAVAAACLLVALLGLRWLMVQLRTEGVGRLDLTEDDREGLTIVHSSAVCDAAEEEIENVRGVTRAAVHLRGRDSHRADITVELADYADIAEIRSHLEESTVRHLRQVTDDDDLPVAIELRLSGGRGSARGTR